MRQVGTVRTGTGAILTGRVQAELREDGLGCVGDRSFVDRIGPPLGASVTILWLTRVTNAATARGNVGAQFARSSAVAAPIGLGIIFVGVIRAL